MLIGLFTTITMLGGSVPTIELTAGRFYEYGECLERVALMQDAPREAFDSKGRPILDVQYDCQIMERDPAIAELQALNQ